MKRLCLLLFLGCLSSKVSAQFWFGPTVGAAYTSRSYQDETWKDRYSIDNTVSIHFGGVMNYTTHEVFSVHTELYVQLLNNSVLNNPGDLLIESNTSFTTLNAPFLLRYRIPMNEYLSAYLNLGPKLIYWVSGSGDLTTDDDIFVQEGLDRLDYKIKFSGERSTKQLILDNPRRLKYALEVGGGFYIDLIGHKRIMIDARYSIGHSFMSFNRGSEELIELETSDFFENFEYRTNMLQISLAYLFGFDPVDSRRGRSTSKQK